MRHPRVRRSLRSCWHFPPFSSLRVLRRQPVPPHRERPWRPRRQKGGGTDTRGAEIAVLAYARVGTGTLGVRGRTTRKGDERMAESLDGARETERRSESDLEGTKGVPRNGGRKEQLV